MALRPDVSIVDYLKSVGKAGSWQDQVDAANHYGIQNYSGTAAQNMDLLARMHKDAYGTGAGGNDSESGKVDVSQEPVDNRPAYEKEKPTYTVSDSVTNALNQMNTINKNKPAEYQSQYQNQIDALLQQVLNQKDFNYDMNADPLYQQYKNQYTVQGNHAMRDTMANAASLTGGYGSSYATTAGSQAYDAYLQQLNDKVPELYQLAYQKYLNNNNAMRDNLSTLQGLDNTAYGRYQDTVQNWYTDRNYYTDFYNTERNQDYQKYLDALASWQTDRNYGYQKDYDTQQQSNWQEQFEYQKYLDALSLAGSGGGTGGSGSSGGSGGGSRRSGSSDSSKGSGSSGNTTVSKPPTPSFIRSALAGNILASDASNEAKLRTMENLGVTEQEINFALEHANRVGNKNNNNKTTKKKPTNNRTNMM